MRVKVVTRENARIRIGVDEFFDTTFHEIFQSLDRGSLKKRIYSLRVQKASQRKRMVPKKKKSEPELLAIAFEIAYFYSDMLKANPGKWVSERK